MNRYNDGYTNGKTGMTTALRSTRPPKRQSKTVAFKLFSDTDYDIIEWLSGLDDGSKSDLIRAALKAFITGQSLYPPSSEASPLETILTRLDDLQQLILSRPVVSESTLIEAVESENLLRDDEVQRRGERLKKARW